MLKSLHTRHNEIFLTLLRTRRELLQLRQRDLAGLLGHGQATVSKVESGARRLDVIELRAWLQALDIDFLDFMAQLDQQLRAHPLPDARLGAGLRANARRHSLDLPRHRRLR